MIEVAAQDYDRIEIGGRRRRHHLARRRRDAKSDILSGSRVERGPVARGMVDSPAAAAWNPA